MAFTKLSSLLDGRVRLRDVAPPEPNARSGRADRYNPDQPRVPKGNHEGGQWTRGWLGGGWVQTAFSRGRKRIEMWRLKHARKGLWSKMPDHKKSAVAVTTFEGKEIYGPNSKHHKYRSDDRLRADHAIEDLVKKYPLDFKTADITRFPNNAIRHAEATVLLRAASKNNGTLAGKTLEVEVDRELCPSCKKLLPLLGRELGNPTVTFTDSKGRRFRMVGGSKTLRRLEDRQ